jgi:hypothetical protein
VSSDSWVTAANSESGAGSCASLRVRKRLPNRPRDLLKVSSAEPLKTPSVSLAKTNRTLSEEFWIFHPVPSNEWGRIKKFDSCWFSETTIKIGKEKLLKFAAEARWLESWCENLNWKKRFWDRHFFYRNHDCSEFWGRFLYAQRFKTLACFEKQLSGANPRTFEFTTTTPELLVCSRLHRAFLFSSLATRSVVNFPNAGVVIHSRRIASSCLLSTDWIEPLHSGTVARNVLLQKYVEYLRGCPGWGVNLGPLNFIYFLIFTILPLSHSGSPRGM